MANGVGLERSVAEMEFTLSQGAIVPVVGSIAGLTKICLGVIQTIGGILAMLISLPFCVGPKGREVFCRGGSHIINGLANIIAGALEAIPIVGTIIGGYKMSKISPARDPHQKEKWTCQEYAVVIGYRILERYPKREGERIDGPWISV